MNIWNSKDQKTLPRIEEQLAKAREELAGLYVQVKTADVATLASLDIAAQAAASNCKLWLDRGKTRVSEEARSDKKKAKEEARA